MKITEQIEQVREFNRFYTKVLGVLDHKMLNTSCSLPESRLLFELSRSKPVTASDLVKELRMDPAYMSRILKKFESDGYIVKMPSETDARKQLLSLTDNGNSLFMQLQEATNHHVASLVDPLSSVEQSSLLKAMKTIQGLLSGKKDISELITIRTHQTGDIGYLIYLHGRFYAREYGFDISFDQYVGAAMVQFLENYNEQKDRLWVVEQDDQIMGSIAIVDIGDGTAQLRWFILEPEAHGKGIGKKLINDAVQFCQNRQYDKIVLWTFADLAAARGLYKRESFEIVKTKSHQIWGQYITEELWERKLK